MIFVIVSLNDTYPTLRLLKIFTYKLGHYLYKSFELREQVVLTRYSFLAR